MRLVLVGGFQRLRRGGFGSGLGGSGGCSFGFALAATHFTWVVRGAAVGQHRRRRFDRGRCFLGRLLGNDRRRLGGRCFSHFRLGLDHWLDDRYRLLGYRGFDHGGFDYLRLLDFTGFHGRGLQRLGDDGRLLGRGFFDHWLRRHFDHRFDARLDGDHWLAGRLLDHRGDGDLLGHDLGDFHLGFGDSGAGALGLLVGLGFGIGADVAGGNGGDDGSAGGQFSAQLGGLVLLWLLLFAGVFVAFDQLAIGVALALTTVAATTLATGAAARTLAIGAFLLVLQQLVVRQLLFGELGGLFDGLRLRAQLALFARSAFFT